MIDNLKKLCSEAMAITMQETKIRAKADVCIEITRSRQSEGSKARVRRERGEM